MSNGIIAYRNLLAEAVSVTASSATGTGPARNAWDGISTSHWETTDDGEHTLTAVFAEPVSADYFACFRHNLGSADGDIVLQVSDDEGATWDDCFTPLMPADADCTLKLFTQATSTHWRVLANTIDAPLMLAVVAFGPYLRAYRGQPVGFTPPRHARDTEVIATEPEGGAMTGRSVIPRGARTEIVMMYVPPAWVRQYWEPFVLHAERMPFFYSWHHSLYPEDCVFARAQLPMPESPYQEYGFQNLRMDLRALLGA